MQYQKSDSIADCCFRRFFEQENRFKFRDLHFMTWTWLDLLKFTSFKIFSNFITLTVWLNQVFPPFFRSFQVRKCKISNLWQIGKSNTRYDVKRLLPLLEYHKKSPWRMT